jgi:vacuolar-type H+-ATPase subunit I/STV1
VSSRGENIRRRFLKTLLLYLGILILLQLIGIAYIIEKPSLHRAILVAIILGTVLPLLLGLIFLRLIKLG